MISKYRSVTTVGIFLFGLIPFLFTPILPIIDFYNHIARFFVLSHVSSNAYLQSFYQSRWALLPDIGVDVIGTPILFFIPPLLAAKIIAAAILAVLYGGVLYFNRSVTGRSSLLVAVLILPLMYSYIFNWGFANFLLGLGLTFWAGGWWLKYRSNPKLAVPTSCVWSVLIFFSHGIAFVMYGILIIVLEIGYFCADPDRKIANLARQLSFAGVQAILPFSYFAFWKMGYAAGGEIGILANLSPPPFTTRLVRALTYHLKTIVRVEEGPVGWFDASTFLLQVIFVWSMIRARQLIVPLPAVPLIGVAILLAMLPLPTLFGVGYIADRLPLFAALCILGSLSPDTKIWTKKTQLIVLVMIGLVVTRIAATAVSWVKYQGLYSEFQVVASKIPPASLTDTVMLGAGFHENDVPRCEMYGPLLVAQYGQISPLFADEKQQPLAMIGALKRAVDGSDVPKRFLTEKDNDNESLEIAAAAGFHYILLCNRSLLKQPLPMGTSIVSQTNDFALLRTSKP